MIVASLSSWLGSVWFAALCLVSGFLIGHLGLLSKWLKK
jgi:hypothetical protein